MRVGTDICIYIKSGRICHSEICYVGIIIILEAIYKSNAKKKKKPSELHSFS